MTFSAKDKHHFLAAQGWFELGDHLEADRELDGIAPQQCNHPDVLALRWSICAKDKKWSACVDLGKLLTQLAAAKADSWIHLAFALHELRRTQEAWDVLAPVAQRFPTDSTIPYNLACYACQLGDLVEARDLLAQAFRLGNARKLKQQAYDDPDLAPLFSEE